MRIVLSALVAVLLASPAGAQPSSLNSLDPTKVVTKDELSTAVTTTTKQSSVPTAGPGLGICKDTVVPSELITSGGVVGTAGTCSRIVQCGIAPNYVVTQFNVGGGC